MEKKICGDCKQTLFIDLFTSVSRSKDGLSTYCKSCISIRNKENYLKNQSLRLKRASEWRSSNPEKQKEFRKRYYEENRTSELLYARNNRPKVYAANKRYRDNNPQLLRERYSYRRALKLKCVHFADRKKIESIYAKAIELSISTGVPHEVDHIVPLVGKIVSGLHCEANLQVIPRSVNRKKSNRHWPDKP